MRLTKLDGLRGVFCVMVILVHYKTEYLPQWVYESFIVKQSGLFVDFFFVISGFVIALTYYNYINSIDTFWSYLKRRWIRLYPLLFFTTTLFVLYYYSTDLLKVIAPDLPIFQNPEASYQNKGEQYLDTILFLNSTSILGSTLGMNYPSWSISSEMIVYIIFGLLLLLSHPRFDMLMLLFVGLCVSFSLYKGYFFFSGEHGYVRAFVSFATGFFVWRISTRDFRLPSYLEYFLVPVLLSLFYFLNSLGDFERQVFGLFLVPLLFGGAILILVKTDGLVSRILQTRPIEFLGKVSYSIYLNHALLLILIPKTIFRLFKLQPTATNQLNVLFITLSCIIIYSHFTHKYIEKGVGNYLKSKLL